MTYTDLRAAIQEYSENYESTFAERVDTFIRQAENRLHQIVRLPPSRKQVSGTLSARLFAPPPDYLSMDSMFVTDAGESFALENKEPEFLDVCYPLTAEPGRPRYYAKLDDLSLQIGPAPDRMYDSVLNYFAYPASIVDAKRSYLGDRCESLLLYASLVEAYTFMKGEPDLLQWYDSRFKEAAALYKQLGDGRQRKDSYQEPDKRVEV